MRVLSIILGGGYGTRLSILTHRRSKAVLPFGGKYRLIDFTLSNIVNSGLDRIAILAQYQAQSLLEHVGNGEPWGMKPGCLQVWTPSIERTGQERYLGTADAVYQNFRYIKKLDCDLILILGAHAIYRQDYSEIIRFHQEKGAELTISTMPVPVDEVQRYGILDMDSDQKVTWFVEKPGSVSTNQASKGVYVFNPDVLFECLSVDAHDTSSQHGLGHDILPRIVETRKVYAYPNTQYWAPLDDIESYWKLNLALLGDVPAVNLYHKAWPLFTRQMPSPPTTVRPMGRVMNSLISEGCVIEGEVMHSVLSPGVTVERGAVVRDSVILSNTIIRTRAVVSSCVLDEDVDVGEEVHLGAGGDLTPNQFEDDVLTNGLTVVGEGVSIPAGVVVGRNCRLDPAVGAEDFAGMTVPSGTTVHKRSG